MGFPAITRMGGEGGTFSALRHRDFRLLGDFPAGALIAVIGGPGTVLLSSAAVGAYGLFVFMTRPAVRSAASRPTPANGVVMGGQS